MSEDQDFSAQGKEYDFFAWQCWDRSRYDFFTESSDLHQPIIRPRTWSAIPGLIASWTGNPKLLEGADSGPQRNDWSPGRKRKLEALEGSNGSPQSGHQPPSKKRNLGVPENAVSGSQQDYAMELSNNRSSTSHLKFCPRCARIDFSKIIPKRWRTSSVKLGKFSQINLEPSCPLCNLFSCITARFNKVSDEDWIFYLCPFYTSKLYAVDWRWSPSIPEIYETVSFCILDERTFQDTSRASQQELVRASGWISPAATSGTDRQFNARWLKPFIEFENLRTWLDFCDLYHTETCVTSDLRPVRSLRVIDCENRTIIPAGADCKYIALSYVWGTSTTSSSEENWDEKRNILPEKLPRTIEDAIEATKRLGYRYLWVDKYCIPQQDDDERREQVYQMDLVYNKAQATIIAAAGNKPTFGLPGVQNLPRAPQMCATISKSEYVFVPPDPAHEIQNSKWNSRGWTHQETVLSRRRLIFCEDQVYFECSSMHCYEAMKLPLEALHVWTRQRFSKCNEPGLFTPLSKQRYPLDETFRQIAQYTKRDLSCPEDILNGMMGIFGAYANIYQSFLHYGGIPIVPDVTLEDFDSGKIRHSTRVEQFATGLCWKLKGPSKRRLGFPSWSWTGWYGVVDTLNGYEGYIQNSHDIKFWVESRGGGLTDFETFCNTLDGVGSARNPGTGLHVDAAVVKVRFQYSTPYPLGTDLQAVLEAEDQSLVCERFYLTTHMREGDNLCQKLLTEKYDGIVLGVRRGTRYLGGDDSGEGYRTMDSNSENTPVVMVVRTHNGMTERLGLITFSPYIGAIDEVRRFFDLNTISTTRRRLRLA